MTQETARTRDPGPASDRPPAGSGWLERYGDALYGYARRRVGRADVAEDLVQEALLAGVRAWPTYAGRADPGTWLTGILRHKVADHLRARYPREGTATSPDHPGELPDEEAETFDARGRWRPGRAGWSGDPYRLAEDREFRQAVDACVAKLPGRMARLFVGRLDGEASTGDLCREMGITPDHGWTLLHRGRLRLRRCLASTWFASDRPGDRPANPRGRPNVT